jgi:thiamine-monophosphate kinase
MGGIFWRDALIVKNGGILQNKESSPLFRPHSQVRTMGKLAEAGVITAAIDNSDGLLPTLAQLAEANSLSVLLDLARLPVPDRASRIDFDPVRFWLGWGDWNIIASVPPDALQRAMSIAADIGSIIIPIGELGAGASEVLLKRGSTIRPAPRLESERFARDSWFASGIEGYLELLLQVDLP